MRLYVRLATDALTDSKLLMVGPEGFTLWSKGLLYSKIHLTDGYVPDDCLPLIGLGIPDIQGCVNKLLLAGLWTRHEGGYSVGEDKWAEHQTTKEQVDQLRDAARERQARRRKRAKEPPADEATEDGVTPLSRPCHSEVTQPETETKTEISTSKDVERASADAPARDSRMKRPTPEDIAAYFKSQASTGDEARKFWDYYTANGWKVGKNPMRDWEAAARGWISRDGDRTRGSPKSRASVTSGKTADEMLAGRVTSFGN